MVHWMNIIGECALKFTIATNNTEQTASVDSGPCWLQPHWTCWTSTHLNELIMIPLGVCLIRCYSYSLMFFWHTQPTCQELIRGHYLVREDLLTSTTS